jgi:hypothetical protein
MGGEELEQLVLHVGQVQRPAGQGGLIGLQVEDERSVLDQVGSGPPPRPPKKVGPAGLQLLALPRRHAEIVEQILSQLQLTELRSGDKQQEGSSGRSRLRRLRHRANAPSGSTSAHTMAPGPAVVGFDPVGRFDRYRRLPRVTGQIESLSQRRRSRFGEEQERFHGERWAGNPAATTT